MLRFHGLLTLFSFMISTLTDAMRSTDISASRASGSRMYHVLPVRLLVCFLSRFICFFTLPLWTVDSSMLTISLYTFPF